MVLAVLDDIAAQHSEVRRLADVAVAAALKENVATTTSAAAITTTTDTTSTTTATTTSTATRCQDGSSPRRYPFEASPREGSGSYGAATSPRSNGKPSRIPKASEPQQSSKSGDNGRDISTIAKATSGGRGRGRAAAGAAGESPTSTACKGERGAKNMGGIGAAGFSPNDQRLLVLLQHYVLAKSGAGREVRCLPEDITIATIINCF